MFLANWCLLSHFLRSFIIPKKSPYIPVYTDAAEPIVTSVVIVPLAVIVVYVALVEVEYVPVTVGGSEGIGHSLVVAMQE